MTKKILYRTSNKERKYGNETLEKYDRENRRYHQVPVNQMK